MGLGSHVTRVRSPGRSRGFGYLTRGWLTAVVTRANADIGRGFYFKGYLMPSPLCGLNHVCIDDGNKHRVAPYASTLETSLICIKQAAKMMVPLTAVWSLTMNVASVKCFCMRVICAALDKSKSL
jgi:hypothetical protein